MLACSFAEECNKNNFLGRNDWRLPTREELRSLAVYDGSIPAVNTEYFVEASSDFYYSNLPKH